MFHRLGRKGVASARKDTDTRKPSLLPLPTTDAHTDPTAGLSSNVPELSPAHDRNPVARQPLAWASNFFKPTRSKPQNSRIQIGPSGAIVFQPSQSQESLASTLLPPSSIASAPGESGLLSSERPTLVRGKHISTGQLRSTAPEPSSSIPAIIPRRRSSENYQPRLSNFLGRHPPPIQRRSTSLPPTLLSRIPERLRSPTPERELLFIGGHTEPPSPKFTKVPRFVPLEIRKTNIRMPYCIADCTNSVEQNGDLCPEHEDQFSTTGTRGSFLQCSVEEDDFPPPVVSTKNVKTENTPALKHDKGSSPGLMAKIKGMFGEKGNADKKMEGLSSNKDKALGANATEANVEN